LIWQCLDYVRLFTWHSSHSLYRLKISNLLMPSNPFYCVVLYSYVFYDILESLNRIVSSLRLIGSTFSNGLWGTFHPTCCMLWYNLSINFIGSWHLTSYAWTKVGFLLNSKVGFTEKVLWGKMTSFKGLSFNSMLVLFLHVCVDDFHLLMFVFMNNLVMLLFVW